MMVYLWFVIAVAASVAYRRLELKANRMRTELAESNITVTLLRSALKTADADAARARIDAEGTRVVAGRLSDRLLELVPRPPAPVEIGDVDDPISVREADRRAAEAKRSQEPLSRVPSREMVPISISDPEVQPVPDLEAALDEDNSE